MEVAEACRDRFTATILTTALGLNRLFCFDVFCLSDRERILNAILITLLVYILKNRTQNRSNSAQIFLLPARF